MEKKINVVNVGLQKATLNVATDENGKVNVTSTNTDSNNTGDSYATAGSVATAITDAIAQTTQQYQGDNVKDSEDKDIIVKRKSSDILKITGGASDVSSNNNIGVTANATDGTLTLRLAKSLDLGSDGKLTIGNASMANDSIKVGGSTLNKDGLTATNVTATTVTGGTLRVGDETNGVAVLKATRKGESSPVLQFGDSTTLPTYLTNVAAGKNDTDAVNYKQLKDLETSLTTTMGGGLTFEGNTSETWKRNLGDTVTIKGGFELQKDETYTDKTTDKNTYVALEKDDASKESLVVRLAKELRDLTSAEFKTVVKNDDSTEKTTAITKVDGSGITITPNKEDGTPDTDKTVSLTVKGLNNGGNKITNVADGEIKADSTDAINGGQLYQYQQATKTAVAQARTQVTGTGAAIVTKTTTTDGRDSYNVHVEETMAFTNADGDKLIKGADGKWYKPADIAGKVYDAASKTWKQVGDDGSLQDLAQQPPAEMIKGADGKWYKPDDIKGLVYNDGAWKKVGDDGSMQEVAPPTATSPSLRLVDADGGTNNTIKLENLASAIGGKVVDEAMNGDNSFINNLRTVSEPENGITPNAAVTTQDLRNLADTGFKLQTSGGMTANQAATTVKLGDTVQVVDGKNTRVSTITNNNGVHSYAINVDGLPMSFTDKDGNALVKVGDKFYKASDIGAGDTLVQVGDKLYKASALDDKGQPKSDATEITASTPAGVSLVNEKGESTAQQLSGIKSSVADVEIKDDKGNVDKNASFTDKLAQVATDAKLKDNAVNVSDLNEVAKAAKDAQATADKGFNVKVSASGTGVASATDDLKENGQNIKPGDTFTFEAGDNITLTQAQGKLTIATNNQGIVNNAQLPVAYTTTDKDGKQQKVYKGEDGQFYTVAGVNKDGNIVGKDGSVTSAKDKFVPTSKIIASVQNADGTVTNPSKLTNVADGAVAKGSKDAINGGQLYEYLGIKEGDDIQIKQVTVNKPDGTTTVINVPTDKAGNPYLTTYNVEEQGEHITNNVYTAIRNMNEQGIKYFHVNAGQDIPEKQASNSEDSNASAKYAASIGYQASVESGAEGGLAIGKGATVTKDSVGSIAIGSGGKVSGKNSISIGSGNIVKGDGSGAFGDPSSVTGDGSYALGNNNTIEANNAFAVGNETKVTADNAVAVGHKTKVTTKNSVALGANAQATQTIEELQSAVPVGDPERVRGYGKQVIGEVSVGGVNEAGEQEVRRITNVAAGSAPTDAVNVSQLEASKYETNKKINRLARDIDKLDKRIDGVAASAAAMANLPQPTAPGKSMVSLGVGSHRSQQAIAIGVSRISDNGKIVIKASATQNTNGNATVGAGVGFQW